MRILRAFLWMRWRVLMNSLERSGARDRFQRFSLAIEQLGPIMAAVLMIPTAIALAAAGGYGGWAIAGGDPHPIPFEALRFLLLAACILTVVGPFLLPANERTCAIRLLLLPISRRLLYVAQTSTALTDPWIFLVIPVVVAVAIGLAAGGAWSAAVVAGAGGVLLLLVLVGITSFVTSMIHLILRDRRRGEFLTLLFILVIPFIGLLPTLLEGSGSRAERRAADVRSDPAWFVGIERRVLPLAPSEMYVRAARQAVSPGASSAIGPLAALALAATVLHGTGLLLFGRILASPGSTGARRRTSRASARAWRIPGISPAASAVAIAQIRLAIRTPRGRSILLAPLMIFVLFGVMMWRGGSGAELGFISLRSGLALAVFSSFASLLAILPIAMNQFAIDGAGLTLEFLCPIDERELLRGKAIGTAVIAGVPALFCIVSAAALFPGGRTSIWMSVPLGMAAIYVLGSPVAAALSALFPRPVDLNSIGRGSNAHGAAGFLGMVTYGAAGAMTLLVVLLVTRVIGRPALAPVVMLVWCVICVAIARLFFIPVRALLARRRENLALIR